MKTEARTSLPTVAPGLAKRHHRNTFASHKIAPERANRSKRSIFTLRKRNVDSRDDNQPQQHNLEQEVRDGNAMGPDSSHPVYRCYFIDFNKVIEPLNEYVPIFHKVIDPFKEVVSKVAKKVILDIKSIELPKDPCELTDQLTDIIFPVDGMASVFYDGNQGDDHELGCQSEKANHATPTNSIEDRLDEDERYYVSDSMLPAGQDWDMSIDVTTPHDRLNLKELIEMARHEDLIEMERHQKSHSL